MDDAAGDLKQALPNVCDGAQIHVEVHQKSSRSLSERCLLPLVPVSSRPGSAKSLQDPALPSLGSPRSLLTSVSS